MSQLSSFLGLDTQTIRWLHKQAISSLTLFVISLSASILSRTCFLFPSSTSVFFLSLWFCRCLSYFCHNEAAAASSFLTGTLRTPSTFLRWLQMICWATRECSCKVSTLISLLTEIPALQMPDHVKTPTKCSLCQIMQHSCHQSCEWKQIHQLYEVKWSEVKWSEALFARVAH